MLRFVPTCGQRGGAAFPAVPSVFGAERPPGGRSGSAAEAERRAAGSGGAAGQDGGGGQRSSLLTHLSFPMDAFAELFRWKSPERLTFDLTSKCMMKAGTPQSQRCGGEINQMCNMVELVK